jgi:hypothetical protein
MNMQTAFDPLDVQDQDPSLDLAAASKLALMQRNAVLRTYHLQGVKATGFSLRGQLRPYASFGVPDGRIRTVYYVQT